MSSGAGRRIAIGLIVLVLIVTAAIAAIVLIPPKVTIAPALAQRTADPRHGAYVAVLGDCVACHTVAGEKPYAGGLAFPTPFGAIYSTNITGDADTGIGHYTLEEFIRMMRFGIARDGRRLYPAMPYTAYARASDEDLQDLLVYLQHDVAPVKQPSRTADIMWPLSMRWPLALWDAAFHDSAPFQPDNNQSPEWNRGAYLVQGLGHCGTCHTPRGFALQEKDVSGNTVAYLSGSSLAGSAPINLRGNVGTGLGAWSVEDVVALLKSGRTQFTAVHGPMTEVVQNSTQAMSDADLHAIAVYVKSLSPATDVSGSFAPSDATFKAIMAGDDSKPGTRIFMDSCSACHRLDGSGNGAGLPRLAGNPSVLAASPESLIAIILMGNRLPSTAPAPSALAMPAFGWRYDDAEVAELASFVRSAWGNNAPAVTADAVAQVRKEMGAVPKQSPGRPNQRSAGSTADR